VANTGSQYGKAHTLKERCLEAIRIYRDLLAEDDTLAESQFAFYLDEAAFVTLGICYEQVLRFGGGVYHPILRLMETLTEDPLAPPSKPTRSALLWCWILKKEWQAW
jgi:hypothetical protein